MSLKNVIRNHLYERLNENEDAFVHKGEIERLTLELGHLASNADRRLRELVVEGEIEKRERNGSCEYRYIRKNTTY